MTKQQSLSAHSDEKVDVSETASDVEVAAFGTSVVFTPEEERKLVAKLGMWVLWTWLHFIDEIGFLTKIGGLCL